MTPTEPPYLVHRSDIHIEGRHDPRFSAWCALLDGLPAGSLLALTGDLTDCGSEEQHQELHRWLWTAQARGHSVWCVPGNHDFSEAAPSQAGLIEAPRGIAYSSAAEARWRRLTDLLGLDMELEWEGALDPGGESRRWLCCGISTVIRDADPSHLARGMAGEAGLARIVEAGRRAREKGAGLIVGCHHSPLDLRFGEELLDAGALCRALVKAGCETLICGHEHEERRVWAGACEVRSAGAGV